MDKRGQVTIFIIIAVIIVGLAILVYTFYPQIQERLGLRTRSPAEFIDTCIKDSVEERVDLISLQGGSLDPENYVLYEGDRVEYLCYTNQYYQPCVVQRPLLKQHIEEELKDSIGDEVNDCFNALRESFQNQGYDVNLEGSEFSVELLPKRIALTFDRTLTLTKGESERHDDFVVVLNNNVYELISIANSVLDWETTYGDAETTVYMNYYRDLKVEKKKQTDGTTVYILTDTNNDKKFQFASRSVVWPPGYGLA